MRVLRLLPRLLGVALLASLAPAQGCFLSAGFNRNTLETSFMFDVVGNNAAGVDVTGLVLHLQPGLYNVDVYERAGTHVGFEMSNAGWNLVGSVGNLISNGNDRPTELPLSMSINVAAGATTGNAE